MTFTERQAAPYVLVDSLSLSPSLSLLRRPLNKVLFCVSCLLSMLLLNLVDLVKTTFDA